MMIDLAIAKPFRIVLITSEVAPYSKTGGLGPVVRDLAMALRKRGHEVRVLTPCYQLSRPHITRKARHDFSVMLGNKREDGQIIESLLPGSDIPVGLIRHVGDAKENGFFDRPGLYGDDGRDYADNDMRFTFFCLSIPVVLKLLKFIPHLAHLNDWQTGLVAPILHNENDPHFRQTAIVYSVHNLEFQGIFGRQCLTLAHLGPEYFNHHRLEFHGQVSFTKAGLVYANKVNTVSPTYRDETLTPEFGCGLHDLLRLRHKDYVGILNGIDYSIRDPRVDSSIPASYSSSDLSGKSKCKSDLQKTFCLPDSPALPVLGFVGRLTNQKGLPLIEESFKALMSQPLQIVFIGAGDPYYHQFLVGMRDAYPDKVGVFPGYHEKLSHLVYAGADMLLMPSRVEPCGLAQMIAMRYGTPPIVRKTGGLNDTVKDYADFNDGTGFIFRRIDSKEFMDTVRRALKTYKDRTQWAHLQNNGMNTNFSWENSAEAYEDLYMSALHKIGK